MTNFAQLLGSHRKNVVEGEATTKTKKSEKLYQAPNLMLMTHDGGRNHTSSAVEWSIIG